MPLVVPGMQSKEGGSGNDKTSDWMNKLMGKKIGEGSDETVCFSFSFFPFLISSTLLFLLLLFFFFNKKKILKKKISSAFRRGVFVFFFLFSFGDIERAHV